MTASQNFSSHLQQLSLWAALPLCSKDNTDLLSSDKLFHHYYHCCKSLAYSNYSESCRCSLISRLMYNLEPQPASKQHRGKAVQGQTDLLCRDRAPGVTPEHGRPVTPIPFTALVGEWWGEDYSTSHLFGACCFLALRVLFPLTPT